MQEKKNTIKKVFGTTEVVALFTFFIVLFVAKQKFNCPLGGSRSRRRDGQQGGWHLIHVLVVLDCYHT